MPKGYIFWDDETANSQQRICQAVYILTDSEGNQIGEAVNQLINPESDFDSFNIAINGIRPDDVVGMPTFGQFSTAVDLPRLLAENIFVAHGAKNADLHHIRKSLAAYGIEMPEMEIVDTKQLAVNQGYLKPGLADMCYELSIDMGIHHDALSDARACERLFWKLGNFESEDYIPGQKHGSSHRSRFVFSGLGLVNGNNKKTVEDVLNKAVIEGHRGNPFEISSLNGLRVVVSGVTPGYDRKGIKSALEAYGAKVSSAVSGRTQYLAIGDNVGQSKIDDASSNGTPIITVGELLEVMDRQN